MIDKTIILTLTGKGSQSQERSGPGFGFPSGGQPYPGGFPNGTNNLVSSCTIDFTICLYI